MLANGEIQLWQNVLKIAIIDAQSNRKSKYEVIEREQAIQWLLHDTKDFYRVCNMADINPEYIREKIRKMLNQNTQQTNLKSFGLNVNIDEIKNYYNSTSKIDELKSDSLTLGEKVPVIIQRNGKRMILMMCWGFHDQLLDQITTSVKIETLQHDMSFKHLIKANRCIIPANYFVKISENMKEHYAFLTHNNEFLSFAGIWKNDGSAIKPSYKVCLIDKKANNIVRTVSARSPLMLSAANIKSWLNTTIPVNLKNISAEIIETRLFKKKIEKQY